ncbi:MAG: 1-acyl-sn-glycerol-3-phosphate acyltransferase [Deltaproteobacteria bacterium]|nr:1-acyl-sn-glycerol-3-phosphate acyltransferase [Deltaproteobacteria bacterium]MBW2695050.1 1-acyl-sn-glycerol-3-phosphate acyltransferase [Deltaproteobacteria bacterium]
MSEGGVDGADAAMSRLVRKHRVQRTLAWLMAPFWVPLAALVLRLGFGYRIAEHAAVRAEFRRIRSDSSAPLLICANHLTLIDSFVIAWALAPAWTYAIHFDSMPWNTPEETNFANTLRNRLLVYLAKCIPIKRGGTREDVAEVLARVGYLLGRGEIALLFPEGGRSRTGRISEEKLAWGVGRIVAALAGCRVLCVYMRGDQQATWSEYPARGDVMRVSLACIEPKSDARGVRRTRDLVEQIIGELGRMEVEHFSRHPGLPPRAAEPAAMVETGGGVHGGQ